jgi:predicted porin
MFVTALSSVKKFTYVYDYRQMTAALGTNTGIANTTYVKVGGKMQATPDIAVSGDVYWLQATEEVLGEDELGFEIDGSIKYNIDKNLQYFVEGGYLVVGDFYDQLDPEGDADDAYVVRHGIQLAF